MLRMRAFDLIHCPLISNGFFIVVVENYKYDK